MKTKKKHEPSYRKLWRREVIRFGDEYRYPAGDVAQGMDWRKVSLAIGKTPRTALHPKRREYRRKV